MHLDIQKQAKEWGSECAKRLFEVYKHPPTLAMSEVDLATVIELSIVALIKASQPTGTLPN